MWRPVASLLLTFTALAWGVLSVAVCFFYMSAFWRDILGTGTAFYAAIIAFVLCLIGARLLLYLADRLLDPYTGPFDGSVYAGAPRDDVHRDWRRYAADIIRSRRYAFYARTRQWDKLAALERERAAFLASTAGPEPQDASSDCRPGGSVVTRPDDAPARTSMADQLSEEEVRRAARQVTKEPVPARPPADRWRWIDD